MAGKVKIGQKKKDKFIGFRAESELIERLNAVLSSDTLFKGYKISISDYVRKLVLKQLKEDEAVILKTTGIDRSEIKTVLEDILSKKRITPVGYTTSPISPAMLSSRNKPI
ncbi:hypothetical protein ACFL5G_02760 [Candidatus Margulisiibacteriota bacterium]